MLPKKYRLPLRNFPDFFLSAHKKHTAHFVIFRAPQPESVQAAFVVPAKFFPLATTRNVVKRRVSSATLPLLQKLEEKHHPTQVVVYVKKTAGGFSVAQLQELLKGAL